MKTNKTAPLSITDPLPIALQFKSLQCRSQALPGLAFTIPYMNMTRFSARYLCGGASLREGRSVSRKRLSIAMAGINNGDVLSQSIAKQIESYEFALEISNRHPMSVELLCDLHTLLSPEDALRGQIRNHQNWVGGKEIESASIITPPPEKVKTLLKEWEKFSQEEDLTDASAAIIAFSYFIVLHPFADGNGRLSRLLLTSFLLGDKSRTSFLSPVLFRLNHFEESTEELFATPRAVINGDWSKVFSYWQRAFRWQFTICEEITKHTLKTRRSLEKSLLLAAKPGLAKALLDVLFEQPLVTLEYVCKLLAIDVLKANDLLESFCQYGVLKRCSLKHPQGAVVFSCERVFSLWTIIDDLLFSHHASEGHKGADATANALAM